MHKIKKIFSICLILLISFCNILNVLADDIDTHSHIYKNYSNEKKALLEDNIITYDEIEDLVHSYNSDVRNNWNSFENKKSSSDIYSNYLDRADALDSLAANASSDVEIAMYEAQADAMRMNADNNVDDSNTNFLNYLILEKNSVLSTKILMLDYLKSLYELKNAQYDKEDTERNYETVSLNYELGNATMVEVLTAKKAVTDAEANLMIVSSNVKNYKRNLIINCGKTIKDDIEIEDIKLTNIDFINDINLDNDISKAVELNYQYDIFKRRYENANTTEYKNQYQINIDSAKDFISSDLQKKYSDLLDAKSTFYNKQISYMLYTDERNKAENEYTNGNISKKEYLNAISAQNISYNEELTSIIDVKIAYETYISSVNGLATAGN